LMTASLGSMSWMGNKTVEQGLKHGHDAWPNSRSAFDCPSDMFWSGVFFLSLRFDGSNSASLLQLSLFSFSTTVNELRLFSSYQEAKSSGTFCRQSAGRVKGDCVHSPAVWRPLLDLELRSVFFWLTFSRSWIRHFCADCVHSAGSLPAEWMQIAYMLPAICRRSEGRLRTQ
jgi:hypothetical protein